MTRWMEQTKYNTIWFNWSNIVIEWEWREKSYLSEYFL